MQTHFDILIVGGGFSGTVLACQLRRLSNTELRIGVIERENRPGRGVAFGSDCPLHLTNVRTNNLSAHFDDPDHFKHWVGHRFSVSNTGDEFVPRAWFGQYIGELLDAAIRGAPDRLQWIEADAVNVRKQGASTVLIQLSNGVEMGARFVVFATGNCLPVDLLPFKAGNTRHYLQYPWKEHTLSGLPNHGTVLILGSGLTAIDQALALHAAKFKGKIVMLSRRGLLPSVHSTEESWSRNWTVDLPPTASGLLAAVRAEVAHAGTYGVGWRSVIDSMRSEVQRLWASLPLIERTRFLRHVRPYWEVHRHRYAPQVKCALDHLQAKNQLEILAGRVIESADRIGKAHVCCRLRGDGGIRTLVVDRIINCTGAETALCNMTDPLMSALLAQKMGRPDPLFLGLDIDHNGALVDSSGKASRNLFTIGPPRKGILWETTSVPEIREQARLLTVLLAHRASTAKLESLTEFVT